MTVSQTLTQSRRCHSACVVRVVDVDGRYTMMVTCELIGTSRKHKRYKVL
jgi:hypothetical protein